MVTSDEITKVPPELNHQLPCLSFKPSFAHASGEESNTTVLLLESVPIWSEFPSNVTLPNRRRRLSKTRSSFTVGVPEPGWLDSSSQYDMSVKAGVP